MRAVNCFSVRAMKYFPPFALAILLAACAVTPEQKQAARQRELEKEAQENFLALKVREHPDRPAVLHDVPAATPKPSLISFNSVPQPAAKAPAKPLIASPAAPNPTKPKATTKVTPQQKSMAKVTSKPTPKPAPQHTLAAASSKAQPTPKRKAPRNSTETVYYWQLQAAADSSSSLRYQAAEARYARTLAKRPENLTPEERVWAHEHY